MQTYGGGEWWCLSLTFPAVKHTEVLCMWRKRWTCSMHLYLIPLCSAAIISCLSMKFQEVRLWQQTLQDTPQGNILSWKCVCCVSIGTFKDLISFSTKKVFLSLVYRPGKMKLPKGKKKLLWPSLPYPKQVFFFIAFKLCPRPLNITLNFTWLRRKILLIPGMVVRQF